MSIELKNIITNKGQSLYDLSMSTPIMVVFLRHFGCIFCQEALTDLSEMKDSLATLHVKLVFVHMAEEQVAQEFFDKYNMPDVAQISDPSCQLYQQFGLTKGSFTQLLGLKTWMRGFDAKKKGIDWPKKNIGDSFQMPGIFIICDGEIRESYIHQKASDRPDYQNLVSCCNI